MRHFEDRHDPRAPWRREDRVDGAGDLGVGPGGVANKSRHVPFAGRPLPADPPPRFEVFQR